MLQNYLKIALRHLQRHPGYTLINITGLAIGIACCLLIVLFIQDELSYDRHNLKGDRTYRLTTAYTEGSHWAPIGPPVGPALGEAFPEIEAVTRFFPLGPMPIIQYGDVQFDENNGVFADSTVFDVFTIPLLAGDARTALNQPGAVVISQSMARKHFPGLDPMGRTLIIKDWEEMPVKVTGVMEDLPSTNHIQFDYMVSMQSYYSIPGNEPDRMATWAGFYTYVVLREGTDPGQVAGKLPGFVNTFFAGRLDEPAENVVQLVLQPLFDIHLHSRLEKEYQANSDIIYVYVFGMIALFILMIACINFVNLTTARAGNRMREVGIRKSLGSMRRQLALQFIGESLLLSGLALVLGYALVTFCLPLLNEITGKSLSFKLLYEPVFWMSLSGMAIFTGLVSGIYPALYISRFSPIKSLKGLSVPGHERDFLRKGLVVFQFSISIFLIAGTIVVFSQLDYFRSKQLGFEKEGVINVGLNGELSDYVEDNLETVKQELLRHAAVQTVSLAADYPGERFSLESMTVDGRPGDEGQMMRIAWGVDHDYIKTLGISIIEGRDFSRSAPADTNAWIINEAAVRKLGLDDPIGQVLRWDEYAGPIVGVAHDFNFSSLHHEIEPLVIPLRPGVGNWLLVRTNASQVDGALETIERTLRDMVPDLLFRYSFISDEFDQLYRSEDQLSDVFSYFSILAIFIACLGLFGLVAYSAERRSKEIGVRKVLGASVFSILTLLSANFAKLVLWAFAVAAPLSYLIMDRWLEAFAYQIDLRLWMFATAGFIALLIALLTGSYQTLKAARTNPVEALRYE